MDLKRKIKEGEVVIGTWITIPSEDVMEIVCKYADLDFIVIDYEHSAMDMRNIVNLVRIAGLYGVSPIVRIGNHFPDIIKRILDTGAEGIMIAMVNSKEDAEKIVSYSHYPPKGMRGVGLYRAQGYGLEFDNYLKKSENIVVIGQIEHKDAIENINEILEVKEIDATIIGPYDLSGSYGIPGKFESDIMKKSLNTYMDACKDKNKPAGIHIVFPDIEEIKKRIKEGYKFIAYGIDEIFLSLYVKESFDNIRRIL